LGATCVENPRVDGSIPSQATKLKNPLVHASGFFYGLSSFMTQINQGRLVIGVHGKEAAHAVHIKRTVG
jgi:hypothetical protein